MALSQYHKDRPFLVITRSATPAEGEKTESKDWGAESKWRVEERVMIVDRVTTNHLTIGTVIIDILKREFVKNRFTDSDPKEVLDHYLKTYKEHIADGLSIWMRSKTGNPEEAQSFISDLEDEIGEMERLHKIPVKIEHDDGESNEAKIIID